MNSDAALVPPTTVQEPFADICQPLFGSALAEVSGTPRPTAPPGTTPTLPARHGSRGVETPRPRPRRLAGRRPPRGLVRPRPVRVDGRRFVPPTAHTFGSEHG